MFFRLFCLWLMLALYGTPAPGNVLPRGLLPPNGGPARGILNPSDVFPNPMRALSSIVGPSEVWTEADSSLLVSLLPEVSIASTTDLIEIPGTTLSTVTVAMPNEAPQPLLSSASPTSEIPPGLGNAGFSRRGFVNQPATVGDHITPKPVESPLVTPKPTFERRDGTNLGHLQTEPQTAIQTILPLASVPSSSIVLTLSAPAWYHPHNPLPSSFQDVGPSPTGDVPLEAVTMIPATGHTGPSQLNKRALVDSVHLEDHEAIKDEDEDLDTFNFFKGRTLTKRDMTSQVGDILNGTTELMNTLLTNYDILSLRTCECAGAASVGKAARAAVHQAWGYVNRNFDYTWWINRTIGPQLGEADWKLGVFNEMQGMDGTIASLYAALWSNTGRLDDPDRVEFCVIPGSYNTNDDHLFIFQSQYVGFENSYSYKMALKNGGGHATPYCKERCNELQGSGTWVQEVGEFNHNLYFIEPIPLLRVDPNTEICGDAARKELCSYQEMLVLNAPQPCGDKGPSPDPGESTKDDMRVTSA